MKTVLVTGGAGFIGSALLRALVGESRDRYVINLDKLTYAGSLDAVAGVAASGRYAFEHADVADAPRVRQALETHRPDAIVHLAAESHVDRSIDAPADFIHTNVVGTFVLLQEARRYWEGLGGDERRSFRFVHVSTDEVFGSLDLTGSFDEASPYAPRSPYAASKASADHLVRAWHHTYGLPAIVTNCTNNYGPFQFPEKLIPLVIQRALAGRPLPVYGRGENVRDWLFVEDHARALIRVLEQGVPGETYAIGGRSERRNLDVVQQVCALLDELTPDAKIGKRTSLIKFVADRPGHDLRYAMDCTKIERELGWVPAERFEGGLRKTVQWYLQNQEWCGRIQRDAYDGQRLGLASAAGV